MQRRRLFNIRWTMRGCMYVLVSYSPVNWKGRCGTGRWAQNGIEEDLTLIFGRGFRFYVAWKRVGRAVIEGLGGLAGGISAAGSASWITSCRAAFAFPWTLRGILVRSLLSKEGGGGRRLGSWCEIVSSNVLGQKRTIMKAIWSNFPSDRREEYSRIKELDYLWWRACSFSRRFRRGPRTILSFLFFFFSHAHLTDIHRWKLPFIVTLKVLPFHGNFSRTSGTIIGYTHNSMIDFTFDLH